MVKVISRLPYFNFTREFLTFDGAVDYVYSRFGFTPEKPGVYNVPHIGQKLGTVTIEADVRDKSTGRLS